MPSDNDASVADEMVLVDSDDEEERKLLLSDSVPPSPVSAPRLAWTPSTSSSAMTDCQDRDGADKEWGHQHPLLQYKQLKSDPLYIEGESDYINKITSGTKC